MKILAELAELSGIPRALAYTPQSFDTTVIDPAGVGALTVPNAFNNVISVMEGTILPICAAIFGFGALLYVASAGNDERKNQGKDFMVGAVIGLAIVVGSRAILDLTMFFIYG